MVNRRQVLKGLGAATVGGIVGNVAFSWSPFGLGLPDTATKTGEPPNIPEPFECDEKGLQQIHQEFDEPRLRYGTARSDVLLPAFKMYTDSQEVSRGETVNITMENVSTLPKHLKAKSRNNLQVLTTEGWQEVRRWTEGAIPPHSRGLLSWPGNTLEWSITMTETDLTDDFIFVTELEVCPDLPVGRYRFVFGGLQGHDKAVGVQFDLVE